MFPNPAQDTHLSLQLILPPLSTGPDQTHHPRILGILPIIKVAHKIWQPFEQQRRLTTGELYSLYKQKSLEQSQRVINSFSRYLCRIATTSPTNLDHSNSTSTSAFS